MIKNEDQKVVGVIPAHLNSIRFPNKILFPFYNIPMIEHVRRRALLCKRFSNVIVATCDHEIADQINKFGGEVIMTSKSHSNGTTRVAEAIEKIDCSHVVIIQGDEPLLLPQYLDLILDSIINKPKIDAWNVTGPLNTIEELDQQSFVKCATTESQKILYCFRRSPSFVSLDVQKSYIRKILGLIAFRKNSLLKISKMKPSIIEEREFIEQIRIIVNGFSFYSISVSKSTPSVNEPNDELTILKMLKNDKEQMTILEKILK